LPLLLEGGVAPWGELDHEALRGPQFVAEAQEDDAVGVVGHGGGSGVAFGAPIGGLPPHQYHRLGSDSIGAKHQHQRANKTPVTRWHHDRRS
jgi:hypothetical protein